MCVNGTPLATGHVIAADISTLALTAPYILSLLRLNLVIVKIFENIELRITGSPFPFGIAWLFARLLSLEKFTYTIVQRAVLCYSGYVFCDCLNLAFLIRMTLFEAQCK